MAESQIPLKFLDISWWRTQQTICRDHKVVAEAIAMAMAMAMATASSFLQIG